MCGLTSGIVFLWFGHVESYTLAMTASLWVIALLTESERHRKRPLIAWIVWIVAVASHALAVALVPALIWGSWKGLRRRVRGTVLARRSVVVSAGMILGAAAAFAGTAMRLQTFVPLYPLPQNNYWFLSWFHILDVANLTLFVAPVVILLLFAWRTTKPASGNDSATAVALAALGFGLFAFWIDPMLGMFRDWDLLGAFGIPLSMVCGYSLVRRMTGRTQEWWFVAVAVLALTHVGSWVAANLDTHQSAQRVDRIVREDAHYDAGYYQAGRRPVWALILTNWLGEHERAGNHFVYRLRHAPDDAVSWANLGIVYQHRRRMDSALVCYGQAMKSNPENPIYALAYGQVQHSIRHFKLAQVALEKAVALAPELYEAQMALGLVYRDLRMYDEAESQARIAMRIDGSRPDAQRLLDEIAQLRVSGTE
jgi:tetratricopeptide (TPR) repeat protein